MLKLKQYQTYTNLTGNAIQYKILYINYLGQWQEQADELKPMQSITKTKQHTKVIIYFN